MRRAVVVSNSDRDVPSNTSATSERILGWLRAGFSEGAVSPSWRTSSKV